MVKISEVIKEYSAEEKQKTGKLSSVCHAFSSALSLSCIDTAFSMLVKSAEGIIEKSVRDAKWRRQIELCVLATDSTELSQDQVDSLLETTTDILKKATIDIQKFILDQGYINQLAFDLARLDDDNEDERLPRILANIFSLLSETLRKAPEFMETLADIIREHDHKIIDHEERIQRMEYEPHDVEAFLQGLTTLRLSQKSMPFAYNYNKLQDVWGRKVQIEKLTAFAEDNTRRFLFWVITGPAGIGKSKLVFHFGRIYSAEKDWLVRELDCSALRELCMKHNWNSGKNILLIIDYANEQDQLTDLLGKLSRLNECENGHKIRVILIAREGMAPSLYNPHEKEFPQWYTDIIHDARTVNDHLYLNEFIDLTGLTVKECTMLHKAFAENHLRREVTAEDEENVRNLIKQEVLDDNGLARPLYALFVIDSYYKEPASRAWDLESLQKQIYERDWINWRTAISGKRNKRENLFVALTNLLLYATIFGKWESCITLPEPLSKDCETVFYAARAYSTDYKTKCFKVLTGKSVTINGQPALVRLSPDMVGEYYVLRRLESFDDNTLHSWAALIVAQISDCRDFFIRAIQDFGNHKSFIDIFLKIFHVISELLEKNCEEAHKAFASILETLLQNYKGNEDDQVYKDISGMIRQYIAKNETHCVYAAELALLFHENRPHIGSEKRIQHLARVETLYKCWPGSRRIASSYISFLGDVVASKIGAHAPGYTDSYLKKFEELSKLAKSPDYVIKKSFIPVLIKMIDRAISVHDWSRASQIEGNFLKEVMCQYDDELALDFVSKFDSVIISLAKERANLFPAAKLQLTLPEQQSKEIIDHRMENSIGLLKYIIDNTSHPSLNFVWTYIGKLARITKNLFIHRCSPYNEALFSYMLNKLQGIYDTNYLNNNILTWRVSRALDEFCDAKSDAVPSEIKAKCILKEPDEPTK